MLTCQNLLIKMKMNCLIYKCQLMSTGQESTGLMVKRFMKKSLRGPD
nr:MAG TPA: hypothetical protein [Caudoviricetes sp.]